MADSDTQTQAASSSAPSNPAKRYLKIGIPLVLGLLIFYFFALPWIEITVAISGLNSHDARARGANVEKLKNYEDKDYVIDMLADAVRDDGREFDVRLICAGLLLDHFDRINLLDDMLKTGDLTTRAVVLKTLSIKPFFQNTYADDPSYRVRETVSEWLARDGDITRYHAIQLAVKLDMREHLDAIRKLLPRSGAPNVQLRQERDLVIAAAGAMKVWGVCEAVPEILAAAPKDPDSLVRLRLMQVADDMTFRTDREVACPGAAPEADMIALVQNALDDSDHRVRMGALLILARQPAWAQPKLDRVREILDGEFSGAERRHALEVLFAANDAADHDRYALYFHDPDVAVRTTAAAYAADNPDLRLEGCLVGLLGGETGSDQLFYDVLRMLHGRAKKWVGFPSIMGAKAARDLPAFKADIRTLFSRGEVAGITRDGLAEAWFGWWCDKLELTEEQKTKAIETRRAAWHAMDRRDVAGVEKALDGLGFDMPGLFTYERAWVQARS